MLGSTQSGFKRATERKEEEEEEAAARGKASGRIFI